MNPYWSKLINDLDPYVAGEQPKDKTYIKLNTNENPYPPSTNVITAIHQVAAYELRLYPDPASSSLQNAIAKHYGIKSENVFVGNGSDEVLGFAFMAFFKQDRALCFPEITYSFYPSYCRLFEIQYQQFAMAEDWGIDFDNITDTPGGVIFPNPNAPTGMLLPLEQIEQLARRFKDTPVIVDEAYIDFGGDSAVPLTGRHPNLLIIQTCSKSRSLAGLRVGYAIGNPDLIEALERVKNSFNAYPLDSLAIAGATASFQDQTYFLQCCDQIIATREWFSLQLSRLAFTVLPSKANFVFASHPQAAAVELNRKLRQMGILVRHFDTPKLTHFLRISIGTRDEMESLVKAFEKILAAGND